MGLAPYGKREIIGGGLILVACGVASGFFFPYALPAVAIVFLWLMWFFRDPRRRVPQTPDVLVAPADGVVVEVAEVDDEEYVEGPVTRMAIFLSIFNCHINRAPCDGDVKYLKRHPGRFMAAWKPETRTDNERNSIGMEVRGREGRVGRLLVRQITGAIARRIVCTCREAQSLERGERVGMIKFGSRTELCVARELLFRPRVKVGDKVYAGVTIMGEFE